MGDGRKKGTELSSSSCLTDHPPIPHGKRQRHHGFLQDKSQTVPPLPSTPAGHGYGGGGTDFPIKIGAFFERGLRASLHRRGGRAVHARISSSLFRGGAEFRRRNGWLGIDFIYVDASYNCFGEKRSIQTQAYGRCTLI